MPFDNGTFALTFMRLPKSLPDDFLELFAARAACKLDDVADEPSYGWVSGRHLLDNEIDEESAIRGGHPYMILRVAERKIPSSLLNAICRRDELVYMRENNCDTVPQKARRQIKADAIERHLLKMPPSIGGVPMAVDRKTDMLYLGTASNAQIDNFVSLFLQTTEIEPLESNFEDILMLDFKSRPEDLPTLLFSETVDQVEPTPERDFLTWLWYHCEAKDALIDTKEHGKFEFIVDGPLTLALADEAKGAEETSVKKGNPMRSAEVKAALGVGKKLRKAKLTLVKNQEVWSGSFDADKFRFGGLTLPEGEEMEFHSKFEERIHYIDMLRHAMRGAVAAYFAAVKDEAAHKKTVEAVRQWATKRDAL